MAASATAMRAIVIGNRLRLHATVAAFVTELERVAALAALLALADAVCRPIARTLSWLAQRYRAHIVGTAVAPMKRTPLG